MPVDHPTVPSAATADPCSRARTARAVLAANAAATEEQGRPTAESRAAAEEAGAFALTTPEKFGGLDADHRTMVRVFAELGAGCPSTAWLAAVSATAKSFFFDWMTTEAQEAVYADPNVRVCGTAMPTGHARRVGGGYLVDGRWSYASGCLEARWAMVGLGMIDDERTDRVCLVMLPTEQLQIDRTWDHAVGLRGTGSHTLVAEEVFVPDSFLMTQPEHLEGPGIGTRQLSIVLHTVAPLLGAARGALDLIRPLMTIERPVFGTPYTRRSQSPSARHLFAESSQLVDTAEQRTLGVADMLDAADLGNTSSATEAAGARMQLVCALRDCRTALDMLLDLHGSSALTGGNALSMFWRDVAMGSRHGAVNPYVVADQLGSALAPEKLPAEDS